MPDINFCFVHIPKTAGSTFFKIVQRLYGPRWAKTGGWRLNDRDVHDRQAHGVIRGQIREHFQNGQPGAMNGHFDFSVSDEFPADTAFYTILRDPVQRVVSMYRFVLRNPRNHLYARAKEAGSLERFLQENPSLELSNDQIRRVAGVTDDDPRFGGRADYRALADAAKSNLLTRFTLFGLTERLDESLVLLQRKLAWPPLYYFTTNVSPVDTEVTLTPRAREMIEALNREEILFYREINLVFGELVRREGEDFQRDLARFRRRNPWIGKWIGLQRMVRSRLVRRAKK